MCDHNVGSFLKIADARIQFLFVQQDRTLMLSVLQGQDKTHHLPVYIISETR